MEFKSNLFIIGAAKAGTTSLHFYLNSHPDVFMCPMKETNFFSARYIENQGLYYQTKNIHSLDDYQALFSDRAGESIIGEASPSYLFYPGVAGKLFNYNPDAKIIIMLRDPVDRALSHYFMDRRLGYVSMELSELLHRKEKSNLDKLYIQQYIQLGQYYEQVVRYLEVFPRDQIRIIEFDQFIHQTDVTLCSLSRFLGIDSEHKFPTKVVRNSFQRANFEIIGKFYQKSNIRKFIKKFIPERGQTMIRTNLFSSSSQTRVSEALKLELWTYFKSDVEILEKKLNLDLAHWKKD